MQKQSGSHTASRELQIRHESLPEEQTDRQQHHQTLQDDATDRNSNCRKGQSESARSSDPGRKRAFPLFVKLEANISILKLNPV
ncbi:MAG: hypothetical protein LAT67_09725 [Balneolales bacterium]|nr:hypothetical protein [Balneolales bacterium]